jgi:hypothetical protein
VAGRGLQPDACPEESDGVAECNARGFPHRVEPSVHDAQINVAN